MCLHVLQHLLLEEDVGSGDLHLALHGTSNSQIIHRSVHSQWQMDFSHESPSFWCSLAVRGVTVQLQLPHATVSSPAAAAGDGCRRETGRKGLSERLRLGLQGK